MRSPLQSQPDRAELQYCISERRVRRPQRLASVMAIVDEVVFRHLDTRIASYLLTNSQAQNPIRTTHQEIAAELGSSREVISRILEDFAEKGFILPSRGIIEVVDLGSLKALVSM